MPYYNLLIPVNKRSVLLMLADAVCVAAALGLAMLLRFEFWPEQKEWVRAVMFLPLIIPARIVTLAVFGMHSWSFRLCGLPEAVNILKAQALGSMAFIGSIILFLGQGEIGSRGVLAMELLISTFFITAVRFGPRIYLGRMAQAAVKRSPTSLKTVIVGAGQAGNLLVRDLSQQMRTDTVVAGFVDDDPGKQNVSIQGYRVLGKIDHLPEIIAKKGIQQVIVSIPSARGPTIRKVVDGCKGSGVKILILPFSARMQDNTANAQMLRDIDPADLLGRPEVEIDREEFRKYFAGKAVLVTGAAGSIGSELARQVAEYGPSKLLLLDMNENGLYMLNLELKDKTPAVPVKILVMNIREREAMERMMIEHRPQIVLHAAAHKHVPLMEEVPAEAIKNNVFGTRNLGEAAVKAGAEAFLMISTDKAVNPTSVMGATKRVAEYVVRKLNEKGSTRFVAVRFGNVLGSAGSVIPVFKEQIRNGGPVTVTHKDMKRYFMTVQEAVSLCLLTVVRNLGSLCVLDMGDQIRIQDLAESLITMAGLVPGKDIEIKYTGLRPGEKLFEELMTEAEETTRKAHEKVLVADNSFLHEDLASVLGRFEQCAEKDDKVECLATLRELVPTFSEQEQTVKS